MAAGIDFRDFGRIQWAPTLKLAMGRSVASGFVITLLMALFGAGQGATLAGMAGFFLMWSLTSAIGTPGVSMMIKGMNAVFAGMGLGIAVLAGNIILFGLSLAVASGDPIVYLLNKRFPMLFEVDDFKLFNLQPTIFVLGETAGAALRKQEYL